MPIKIWTKFLVLFCLLIVGREGHALPYDTQNSNYPLDDLYSFLTIKDTSLFPKSPVEVVVEKGDTFGKLLKDLGIDAREVPAIVTALEGIYDPDQLRIGQKLEAYYSILSDIPHEKYLISLKIQIDYEKEIQVFRTQNLLNEESEFWAQEVLLPLNRKVILARGVIRSSFFETAQEMGIPLSSFMELIGAYNYVVDFQRDILPGQAFEVLYESFYDERDELSHYGKILYASLQLEKEKLQVFLYESPTSSGREYFTHIGQSVRKALLKTPINGARISSKFGMRMHPIYNYTKLHKGIDFAAPVGTAIFAAGDGMVEFMGRKGGYGNYLIVRHNSQYATAYAHIHRFARGIRRGSRVKQGQVVAYVGSTGNVTGAHLHYEVLKQGRRINPSVVKTPSGIQLKGKDLEKFKQFQQKIFNKRNYLVRSGEVQENQTISSAE